MLNKASAPGLISTPMTNKWINKFCFLEKMLFGITFVEDTYSSEEMVDQQPVLVKVMDTADQVTLYSIIYSSLS